jgi:hypothetical protein
MQNHITINKKITNAISWNAGEAIFYHLLLMSHQAALFTALPREQYGLIGITFSILYLSVWIIDVGLESLLAPRFAYWSTSRETVHLFFTKQSIPTIVMWLCASTGALFFKHHTVPLVFTIALTALFEYVRRIQKTMLLILLENKFVAFLELLFMSMYLSFVWSLYFFGIPLTVYTTLLPLLCSSAITLLLGTQAVKKWYYNLPEFSQTPEESNTTPTSTIKFRLLSYINSLGMLFFSSNFLVPLFAAQFGVVHAGILKLASSIVHSITVVLQRTFGNSCRALLAQTQVAQAEIDPHAIFNTITTYLYQVLYGLLIFCLINHQYIARLCGAVDTYSMGLLFVFFVINFLDNFVITLEKLYEFNESIGTLCIFNSIGAGVIVALALRCSSWGSPITLLLFVALTRLSTVVLTIGFSYLNYKVTPYKKAHPTFILIAIIASLLFFFSSNH